MEIAIPLIALGGMYIISNQKNENCDSAKKKINKESYENMGSRGLMSTHLTNSNTENHLPNVEIEVSNYPVINKNQLFDTVQEYKNPNTATDKYFDQNLFKKKVNDGISTGNNIQQIFSLTGNYLESNQFTHNNMIPFNGGKVKGRMYNDNIAESVLDNMVGTGSQLVKKIEQAPLFKPQENMQWAYGAPNNSDFYQSRVNPGMKNNNTKPFDTVMVGPGLDQGYGINGTGGYNSGMEARDKWLPYTVDQLRVATNPKLEYKLVNHEGPAQSQIKNVGLLGRVEKQKPDTYFINTQDRWLTTTGSEKGETLRPIQEMGIVRRNDILTDYTGPAGPSDVKAGYAPENFEPSRRHMSSTCDVPVSTAVGRGPITDGDNNMKSHSNYENNRSTLRQPDTFRSGFGGAIGAVIAPLMDILRPSRKEETISSARVYGEVGSNVPKSYVINPNDTTPTTVKETTLYSPHFNINNQNDGIYVNNYTSPDLTQRDTSSCQPIGTPGGQATSYGDMNYSAAYKQHNNDIKSSTIANRPNQGGTQVFNQQMNVNISRNDVNRYDGRMGAPSSVFPSPPSVQTYGKINTPQYYNECAGCDRISPDILSAFRSNPYTHSLTTSV
jgi:hypothetical protein